MSRVYNFSAGPSCLPLEVLEKAGAEITDYKGSGQSVMEMSHRSAVYLDIFNKTKADFIELLGIPDEYDVLFMQGGATFQFAAVPLNLMGENGSADYANTGNFANLAAKEAKKYGTINIAASSEDRNHTYIPAQADLKLNPDASYFYYCANNTIYGTEWKYVPETGGVPIVTDMSSNICSKLIDVSKYGVIFAGVQKNLAPAGMAVVVVRRDLLGREIKLTPKIMSYNVVSEKESMDNTPPCYTIYMLGLVLEWLKKQGGLAGIEKYNAEKAKLLYDYLDESKLFKGCADREARSAMNATFVTGDEARDKEFISFAKGKGLINLAGHRSVGGMRASIYNAMPIEGVKTLVAAMKEFEAGV